MTELQVDPQALSDYGGLFESFGTSNVKGTAEDTRTYCGVTSDMDGLLDLIAPAIRAVADGFANHYDDVSTVVTRTGTALTSTAQHYTRVDHAVAAVMDKSAVASGSTDRPMGSGGGWTESYFPGGPNDAESDPAAEIRSEMAADVRSIDWVFSKFTGHHITEPIDAIVGNWTTLTARGKSWDHTYQQLQNHGDDVLSNAAVIDGVWNGVAATTFQTYASQLGTGFKAEAEIPFGIKLALDKLASEWGDLYQQAVDLLQDVIHDVEIAAVALAAGWWCGVGEAVAAEKCGEALHAFYRAYKIVKMVERVIKVTNAAVKGFEELKEILDTATHLPSVIEGKVDEVKDLLGELGSIPEHLDNLANLGDTPTEGYHGPNDPHV